MLSLNNNVEHKNALDFMALGALVHRLDPGIVPFRKANECKIHVSGGEYNCAANLADCFGLKTGLATAMVNYPIGHLIAERVRAMGVKPFYKHFEHDGVRGPNMATVYSDRGYGNRAPEVFYNRCNEAAGLLEAGDFDWKTIFADGVRWFHSGGIFAALSPTMPDLIIEGMKAAKAAGAVISFDLNYREKLWNVSGGKERAAGIFDSILEHVDVLIGTDLPSNSLSGQPKEPGLSGCEARIARVLHRHPQIKVIATALREEHSANRHSWQAVASIDGKIYVSPKAELDVYDRVGSGDGMASGFFYGLLTGQPPQEALNLGWAHGGLLMSYPGDTTMANLDQVRSIAHGDTARIRR
jgi:2-dehydro-3-deoxygluconokinase